MRRTEKNVTGFLGSTEGTFEVCGSKFKVRILSAVVCFPPATFSCLCVGTEWEECRVSQMLGFCRAGMTKEDRYVPASDAILSQGIYAGLVRVRGVRQGKRQ